MYYDIKQRLLFHIISQSTENSILRSWCKNISKKKNMYDKKINKTWGLGTYKQCYALVTDSTLIHLVAFFWILQIPYKRLLKYY